MGDTCGSNIPLRACGQITERSAERTEQGKDSWVFSHRKEQSPPRDRDGVKQQRTTVLSPGVWAHVLQGGSRHNLGQTLF